MRRLPPQVLLAGVVLLVRPGDSLAAFGPDVTAAEASFRFVVLSDAHVTVADLAGSRAELRAVVDEVNGFASRLDFVLVAGDLGQSDDATNLATELDAARQELDRLVVPYHTVLGNHDVTLNGDDSAYRATFGSTSYRFSHAGVEFVAMRTAETRNSSTISAAALDSLDRDLSGVPAGAPLIVFSHHPLGLYNPVAATNCQEFYDRVDSLALLAVFSGHFHGSFEEQRRGVWYCTASPVSLHRCTDDGTTARGYRLVTVWPDQTISSRAYEVGYPPQFAPEPPRLLGTGNRSVLADRPLHLVLAARDESGDPLTYAASGLPAGAVFDPAQHMLSWTPSAAQVGLHPGLCFTASNLSGTDSLRMAVRVLGSACSYEDFSAGVLGWTEFGGNWVGQDGKLLQSTSSGGSYYFMASGSWTDIYLEADVEHELGAGYCGVVFRYQDAANNYYLWNNGARLELRRRVGGVASRITDAVAIGSVSGSHHVRVETVGPNIKVYWDGDLKIDVDDYTFASGQGGLVCSQSSARFDNFQIVGCAGLFARAPVLAQIGARTLLAGVPFQLDLAATDPDGQMLQFSALGLPPGAHFDAAIGRFTWTPTAADARVWGDVRFRVDDGELDDAETVQFTILDTSDACTYENFSSAAALSKWTPDAGGMWSLSDSAYVGSASGTSVSIQGPQPLPADYTCQARLRVEGAGYGNLVFRVVDATHYYYLYTSNSSGTMELRKLSGSSSTVLLSGGEISGSITDRWHLYRIEVRGDVIRVWVDDEPRFEYRDVSSPYLQGGIGLRVVNATLRTDDLVVSGCSSPVDAPDPTTWLRGVRNEPNPFNPNTTVYFDLVHGGVVSVVIYDVAGRTIRRLFDGTLHPGSHQLGWDGRDEAGTIQASGIYYLRVRAAAEIHTRNLVLLK